MNRVSTFFVLIRRDKLHFYEKTFIFVTEIHLI